MWLYYNKRIIGGNMALETKSITKTKSQLKEPKKYKVVMYNDDFTPMDFVVDILKLIFKKEHQEAVDIMMQVHKGDKAVVGMYAYDIAMTKTQEAIHMARQNGYPFQVKVES